MDIVVVYKVNHESLQTVLGFLQSEGFNPTTLEDPSSPASLSGCGRANYMISIAVPAEEAFGATSVLRNWELAQTPRVESMIGKLAGPFLGSVIIVGVLAVVLLAIGILLETAALLFLAWLVVFALLANVEKIAQKLKKK